MIIIIIKSKTKNFNNNNLKIKPNKKCNENLNVLANIHMLN